MTSSASAAAPRSPRALGIVLWIAQIILAGMFALAGLMKVSLSAADLAQQFPYAADLPLALVRFIGVAELAGALGMLLPAALRILPKLTPLAALGFLTIMVLATGFHLSRGEAPAVPVTLGLGLLAALVAWGRLKGAPTAPRA
jgi:uncharacterized membrane protein YphA (DoxX/SURF4 family)